MDTTRRNFLRGAAFASAGLLAAKRAQGAQLHPGHPAGLSANGVRRVGASNGALECRAVQTPDVPNLSYTLESGVKVFHLVAEPVKQELLPGKVVDLWGYNGSAPGPTIQVQQGDRVRIVVDNHLPEATSMHWHGFEIPSNMDGVPGIGQDPIPPGGRFTYEFTLHQEGTYFYHSHMAMQEMMGMIGAFIMHPREAYQPRVDQDFALILQEYAILPNNAIPNSMNMEFNWLTINGKAGPANTPLLVRVGDRVRLRLINLGMDHHPIHVHGHTFVVTGTEGGRQPQSTWGPGNTVLVGVAQARDVEFVANNPGAWMVHCHLPHHMMNQMSSMVGPMSRTGRGGMSGGAEMERGMGMPRQGSATSEENGPSIGRGLGVGSTLEERISNGPRSLAKAGQTMATMGQENSQGAQAQMPMPQVSAGADAVPGFPQDAFMEGPMMAMDQQVNKPENAGLRPGWSGYMQGMMTLLRVLPPEEYDRITSMRGEKPKPATTPEMKMPDHMRK